MKKNKLILKACLGSLLPIFTIPVATSVSGPMINSGYIYFQGRKFNNTEEALKYLVQNNKVQVGNKKVLGDVERSYINMETGQLNKDLLPNYDVSKMNFAYNTAGGGLTQDYNKAKRTYFNKGMILKRYDDGYDNSFLSSRDASNSMRNKTIESKLGFVNVDYVNYDGNSLIKKKLNPFNEDDISNYKDNIKENIFNILADNISNYDNPKLGYKVKVKNNANPSKPTMFLKQFEDVEIKGWIKDSNPKQITFDKEVDQKLNTLPFHFKTKKYDMGYGLYWNERFEGYLKGSGKHSLFINGNNSKRSSWFEGDWDKKKINFKNKDHFLKFINEPEIKIRTKDNRDDWSEWSQNPLKLTSHSSVTQEAIGSHSDIKLRQELKNLFNNEDILKKSQQLIFGKKALRKEFFKLLQMQVKQKIDKSKSKENYQIISLPKVNAKYDWHWRGAYHYNNVMLESDGMIKYRSDVSITIPKEITLSKNVKETKSYNSLVNYLLSIDNDKIVEKKTEEDIKNDVWLTISKNGRDLFEVKLMVSNSTSKEDKQNSRILTEIRKAEKNHINKNKNVLTFNPNPKVLEKDDPQKFFYKILKQLKQGLIKNEDSSKKEKQNNKNATSGTARIFEEYFGKNSVFKEKKNDPRFKYDADFTGATSKTEEKINFKDMIKLYINIISDVYYEYDKFPKILKRISKNIIDPDDILIVNDEKGISISDLTLGKYMIKSISDFNAPVSNGTFSTDDLLATNRATWSVVKNNVDFNPTLLIIVYDQNGERVNSDDYDYDDETILEFNSRLISEPRRNFEWIYVDGHHGPVENITTTIQYVTIDDHTLYFKTFRQLKEYMLKYILKHSTRG